MKISYQCKKRKVQFGRRSCDVANTSEIFVDPELIERNHDETAGEGDNQMKRIQLQSYKDFFSLKDRDSHKSSHILLFGGAGTGKTTQINRIACDWAESVEDSELDVSSEALDNSSATALSDMRLVFVLDASLFESNRTVAEAVKTQLLHDATPEDIEQAFAHLQKRCLVLFDGFDEIAKDLKNHALDRQRLSSLFVLVTTRTHMRDEFCSRLEGTYTQIELKGFSKESAVKYIEKLFQKLKNPKLATTLTKKLNDTPLLSSLSSFPILLVMICHLWERHMTYQQDKKQKHRISFESMTKLYEQAVSYLNKPLKHHAHEGQISPGKLKQVLRTLGQTALEELFKNNLRILETVFQERDCLQAVEDAIGMGLVVPEEGILRDDKSVSFIHKTFQEYSAAVYLSCVQETDAKQFGNHLQRVDKENVDELECLLQFSCGINLQTASSVLSHVVNLKCAQFAHVSDTLSLSLGTAEERVSRLRVVSDKVESETSYEFHAEKSSEEVHVTRMRNPWKLPLLLLIETEMSHVPPKPPSSITDPDPDPEPLPFRFNKPFEDDKRKAELFSSILHFTFETTDISRESWLGEIRNLQDNCGVHSNKVIKRIQNYMFSLQWEGFPLGVLLQNMMKPVLTLDTLKDLQLFPSHTLDVATLATFLRYLNSLVKLSLCNVNSLAGNTLGSPVNLSDSLKQFILSGGGRQCNVTVATLVNLLSCMPALSKVSLIDTNIQLDNDSTDSPVTLSESLKELKVSSVQNKCTIDLTTLVCLLRHMPTLKQASIENVEVTGQLSRDKSWKKPCELLTRFEMIGKPGRHELRTVSVTTLLNILGCMPVLARVSLQMIWITDALDDDSDITLSDSLTEFEMRGDAEFSGIVDDYKSSYKKPYIKECPVDVNTLASLLKCMPGLEKVLLNDVQLATGRVDSPVTLVSKSLKELKISGRTMSTDSFLDLRQRRIDMVDVTALVSLISYMPALTKMSLDKIQLSGEFDYFCNTSIDVFKVSNIEMKEPQSMTTLVKLLGCMKCLTKVSFDNVNVHKADDVSEKLTGIPDTSIEFVEEFEMSGKATFARGDSTKCPVFMLVKLLRCLPGLKKVSLDKIQLLGELDDQQIKHVKLSESLEEFDLSGGNMTRELDVVTFLRLASVMSEQTKLNVANIQLSMLRGDLTDILLDEPVRVRELKLSGDIGQMFEKVSSLLSLLGHMVSLSKLSLENVKLSNADNGHCPVVLLSQSLKEFVMTGGNNRSIDVTILLSLFGSMPALAAVTLRGIDAIGVFSENQHHASNLTHALKKFSCVDCTLTTQLFSIVMSTHTPETVLRSICLKSHRQNMLRTFLHHRLTPLRTLEVGNILSKGASGGKYFVVNTCMTNLRQLDVSKASMNKTRCKVLCQSLIKEGMRSDSHTLPLEKLNVSGNNICCCYDDFKSALPYMKNLKYLSLLGCKLEPIQSVDLGKCLSAFTKLEKIAHVDCVPCCVKPWILESVCQVPQSLKK